MPAPPEDLSVTEEHDIYPGIDPKPHYETQTYTGKVAFITGASRGIGKEIAIQYARSGASLALIARDQVALDEVKAEIRSELPKAGVVTFVVDVTDSQAIKAAIEGTVKVFGRLDIAIGNAGKTDPWNEPFFQTDADNWWRTVEVNIRGVYNVAHFALPELIKTKGYNIIIGSVGGQLRIPFASSYVLSKHAVNRLNEYVHSENPDVKSFCINPGAILTKLSDNNPSQKAWMVDTLQLPACTLLRLTSGKEDWLSGRFLDSNWNLDEVDALKEKILEQDALVNRLALPV